MGAFLPICYIFAEHLFIRILMEGASRRLGHISEDYLSFLPNPFTLLSIILDYFWTYFNAEKGANLQVAIITICLYSLFKAALLVTKLIVIAYKKKIMLEINTNAKFLLMYYWQGLFIWLMTRWNFRKPLVARY